MVAFPPVSRPFPKAGSSPSCTIFREPGLNLSVNKRELSTGENGECGAFERVLGQIGCPPAANLRCRRTRAELATQAKCFAYGRPSEIARCCQQNRHASSYVKLWLPRNATFQLLFSKFLHVSGARHGFELVLVRGFLTLVEDPASGDGRKFSSQAGRQLRASR